MPLFDNPVPTRLLWPINAPWPKRRVRLVMRRFEACFPDIIYDMDLAVCLANAQAFRNHGSKCVRLYGGLVRHRRMSSAGLAVALAHETGHHLAGAPYLSYCRWLSTEERATIWAMEIGLEMVFGRRAKLIIDRGLRDLNAVGIG